MEHSFHPLEIIHFLIEKDSAINCYSRCVESDRAFLDLSVKVSSCFLVADSHSSEHMVRTMSLIIHLSLPWA